MHIQLPCSEGHSAFSPPSIYSSSIYSSSCPNRNAQAQDLHVVKSTGNLPPFKSGRLRAAVHVFNAIVDHHNHCLLLSVAVTSLGGAIHAIVCGFVLAKCVFLLQNTILFLFNGAGLVARSGPLR
jgi:hypothetical protein